MYFYFFQFFNLILVLYFCIHNYWSYKDYSKKDCSYFSFNICLFIASNWSSSKIMVFHGIKSNLDFKDHFKCSSKVCFYSLIIFFLIVLHHYF